MRLQVNTCFQLYVPHLEREGGRQYTVPPPHPSQTTTQPGFFIKMQHLNTFFTRWKRFWVRICESSNKANHLSKIPTMSYLSFFKLKISLLDFINLSVSFGKKILIKHGLNIHMNVDFKYSGQNLNICVK